MLAARRIVEEYMSVAMTVSALLMTITISSGPGNPRDWVGVFPIGAANDKFISWAYLACGTQTCPTSKSDHGTVRLYLPINGEEYEIRFMGVIDMNTYNVIDTINAKATLN